MLKKLDSIKLGIVLGIGIPTIIYGIALLVFTQIIRPEFVFSGSNLKVLPRILSLCVYLNLLWFFLLMRKNYMKGARGIIFGTIVMALIVFALYYLT